MTLTPTKPSLMGPSPSCVDIFPRAIFEMMMITVNGVCGTENVEQSK